MQSSSAAVAKITAGTVRAVESSVAVVDHTFAFVVFVGAFNVIFILVGAREAKKIAATQSV